MANTINLGNVNISINEFQRISCGVHNAGEVKLVNETTLDRMNHHVHATLLNGDKISHNQVIAIKEAFIKALSQNGLTREEVNNIRKQLGLASTGAADRTLRARSMTPLSRQQIREILDQYAGRINETNPEAHIETSQELYGPNGMNASNVRRRESVAAALDAEDRQLYETRAISQFQAVIAGKIDFRPAERAEFLLVAQSQLDMLMTLCDSIPRPDVDVTAKFTLEGGLKIEMPTGMKEPEYAMFLEDMIVRLRGNGAPRKEELDAYAAYKKLDTAEKKEVFFNRLADDAQGGMKARAIAVRILFTAGITDHATLSVVNRLNDANAIALARQLATYPKDTPAEQLRADGLLVGMRAMVANESQHVQKGGKVYIPATSGAAFNKAVIDGIKENENNLFDGFRAILDEADALVLQKFGKAGRPDNLQRTDLLNSAFLSQAIRTDDNAVRITPASVREDLLKAAKQSAAYRIMGGALRQAHVNLGRDIDCNPRKIDAFVGRNPEFLERLAAIDSPDAINGILQEMQGAMNEFIETFDTIKAVYEGVNDKVFERIAAKLGVSTDIVKQNALDLEKFTAKTNALIYDLAKNRNLATREDYENAFNDVVNQFVLSRSALLDKVDGWNKLPVADRSKLKLVLLNLPDVSHIDLDRIATAALGISTATLDARLRANASRHDIYAAMKDITAQIDKYAATLMEGRSEIGQDDLRGPRMILSTLVVNLCDGLKERINAFLSKPKVKADLAANVDRTGECTAADAFLHLSADEEVNLLAKNDAKRICCLFTAPKAFVDMGGAARAETAGYHSSELPAIKRAFTFYMAVTGCSAEEALTAILDTEHTAHRLMEYGGRFMDSVENFKRGLDLIEKFRTWYTQSVDAADAGDMNSLTKINMKTQYALPQNRPYIERLVFEEIGRNPNVNLDAENLDSIFGMESNKASRFVLRGYASTIASTIASLPHDKRDLLFDVFDKIDPLATTAQERNARRGIDYNAHLAMRVLKHYDEIAALRANGQFDRPHLVQLLYADFQVGPNDSNSAIAGKIDAEYAADLVNAGPLGMLFGETSGTLQECRAALANGPRPTLPPGAVQFGGDLADLEGLNNSSRDTMLRDLSRPSNSTKISTGEDVIAEQNKKYVFRFEDGEVLSPLVGDEFAPDVIASANAVSDKLEALCGKAHKRQLSSLYLALSQSAMGPFKGNCFKSLGYITDEHMAMTYSLAKNNETGAITITYTPPEGYPINFSWTTTIGIDGKAVTTPMVIHEA